MSEDRNQPQHFSKEGITTIAVIALAPVLYVLSPPLVFKGMLMCGMSMSQIGHFAEFFYAPIKYLMAPGSPLTIPLRTYYMTTYEWLGIFQ